MTLGPCAKNETPQVKYVLHGLPEANVLHVLPEANVQHVLPEANVRHVLPEANVRHMLHGFIPAGYAETA
jgi:hypothetical protein